jgi:hypothetical protein
MVPVEIVPHDPVSDAADGPQDNLTGLASKVELPKQEGPVTAQLAVGFGTPLESLDQPVAISQTQHLERLFDHPFARLGKRMPEILIRIDSRIPNFVYSVPMFGLLALVLMLWLGRKELLVFVFYTAHIEALGVAFVGLFVGTALGGMRILQRHKWIPPEHSANDFVSNFIAATGIFYALAMGVIAVATWDNFKLVSESVLGEARAVNNLYRFSEGYPTPRRQQLRNQLKQYVNYVINEDWKAQKVGQVPDSVKHLNSIASTILTFTPASSKESVIHAQILTDLGKVMELHLARMHPSPWACRQYSGPLCS